MRTIGVALAFALVLAACSSPSEIATTTTTGGTVTAGGGSTTTSVSPITVFVELPEIRGSLFGSARGRVLDDEGSFVTRFEFRSGWVIPEDGSLRDATASGATKVLTVMLPTAGIYVFVLGEFAVTSRPCGTCEAGLSGGSVRALVQDRARVELIAGDSTWVS